MKKLLSLILATIMAISALITVSAKERTKTPNTYVPSNDVYNFSKGTIHSSIWGKLIYIKNNGKEIILDEVYPYNEEIFSYYVRGDKVYYSVLSYDLAPDNSEYYQIRSVNLNGKNKKALYLSSSRMFGMIGGYGSGIIFYEYSKKNILTVKMLKNNKTTTLFKVKGFYDFNIFNGKIYYNNKSFNLKTHKTDKYVAKEIYVTKNYMYYINKNNNLKSLDKKGARRIVTKNVHKYYGANNGSSVIFSKLDSKKEEVFYKRTGTGKEYRLCAWSDIFNVISKPANTNLNSEYVVSNALFYKNNVYFDLGIADPEEQYGWYSKIVAVATRGGTPKVILEAEKNNYTYMSLYGDKLIYREYSEENLPYDD